MGDHDGIQKVSFEIEVADLTEADVQSNLQTYEQALADELVIDVARVTLTIPTLTPTPLSGATLVATVTASDADTATVSTSVIFPEAKMVKDAVTVPGFAASVATRLQDAGVTVVLTVDTATISIASTRHTDSTNAVAENWGAHTHY